MECLRESPMIRRFVPCVAMGVRERGKSGDLKLTGTGDDDPENSSDPSVVGSKEVEGFLNWLSLSLFLFPLGTLRALLVEFNFANNHMCTYSKSISGRFGIRREGVKV